MTLLGVQNHPRDYNDDDIAKKVFFLIIKTTVKAAVWCSLLLSCFQYCSCWYNVARVGSMLLVLV